jgi:hypothetical protein
MGPDGTVVVYMTAYNVCLHSCMVQWLSTWRHGIVDVYLAAWCSGCLYGYMVQWLSTWLQDAMVVSMLCGTMVVNIATCAIIVSVAAWYSGCLHGCIVQLLST